MDTALAIATMTMTMTMTMIMKMAAHPLPPQTVVFNFPEFKIPFVCNFFIVPKCMASRRYLLLHTSQKSHAKKGISQSIDLHKGLPYSKGSRFAHVTLANDQGYLKNAVSEDVCLTDGNLNRR